MDTVWICLDLRRITGERFGATVDEHIKFDWFPRDQCPDIFIPDDKKEFWIPTMMWTFAKEKPQ